MANKTTNVGLVKAIFVGTNPPVNQDVVWKDTNVGYHKVYNESTGTWDALINFVLIDNDSIKRDENDRLYVDPGKVEELSIANGSITLLKLANIASGTLYYRKTAGDGPPEVQTLVTLKEDLQLEGENTGDQDLTGLVPNTRKVNNKALSGDITLTPEDIGSPAGSGTSAGENTGDETKTTILTKLEITVLSGDNTGNQTALTTPILDAAEIFTSENVEFALLEVKSIVDDHTAKLLNINKNTYEFTLAASDNIPNRLVGGITLGSGAEDFEITAGEHPADLLVTHNLDRKIAVVTIFSIDNEEESQLISSAAYTGLKMPNTDSILIMGLSKIEKPIRINLIFV